MSLFDFRKRLVELVFRWLPILNVFFPRNPLPRRVHADPLPWIGMFRLRCEDCGRIFRTESRSRRCCESCDPDQSRSAFYSLQATNPSLSARIRKPKSFGEPLEM